MDTVMEQTFCQNCNSVFESSYKFCPNCGCANDDANQPPQNEKPPHTDPSWVYTPPTYDPPLYASFYGNGFGTAGLWIGILSRILFWFAILYMQTERPNFFFAVWLIGICITSTVHGMALSIVGLCRRFRPKGKAIAGLILNAVSLFIVMIIYVVYVIILY